MAAGILERIAFEVALAARQLARQKCRSQTLRAAMRVEVGSDGAAAVSVPHYWARFFHDGRRGFVPRLAKLLVWFKDPRLDPRFSSGYPPVRRAEVRRLTREEFRAALLADQVVVAEEVGPQKGNPFFVLPELPDRVRPRVRDLFDQHVRELARGLSQTQKATGRL